jgi:hypothetical protein
VGTFLFTGKRTEGAKLSGIKTPSGRISGETDVGAEGARLLYSYNLSGKRTELMNAINVAVLSIFRDQI